MWNAIGEFLRIWNQNNVYIYGKYSYLAEIPDTSKLYIMKRNDCILLENSDYYFDQVISVHCYQLLDVHNRVIQNPLRIRGISSDNTDPFEPRKAIYMSITTRNYTGPEIPDDFENEEYTKEYYFMRNGYGIFTSETGFGSPQNMQLIVTTKAKNISDEEMTELIRMAYVDDFSEEDDESDEDEISITSNRSGYPDNSHVPLN